MPAPAHRLINSYLGPYVIRERIAEGGTANVFLAQSPTSAQNRLYVAKILKDENRQDRECQAGIRTEYEILSNLGEEGYPRAHRFEAVDGLPGIIMDYVEGANVYQLMLDAVPFARVTMFLQMIRLAARLHQLAIIHNDLKPENFILHPGTGTLSLIDFGNTKRPSRRGITTIFQRKTLKRVRGTPAYMAPELLERKRPTFQSDVYALGACAHHLLTGHPIRSRREAAETIAQTRQATEIRMNVPELPREANDLLNRCLRLEPEARPQHAGFLLKALKRAIPEEMISGRCPLSARLAEQARQAKTEREQEAKADVGTGI